MTQPQSRELRRRQILQALAAGGALVALGGCGTAGSPSGTGTPASTHGDTIVWGNWTLYLDFDKKTRTFPTLEAFQAKTGHTVEYREDIDDNVSFNGKVAPILANGQDIGYDVVCPSDSLVADWIRKGYVAPLDMSNIPNQKSLLPALRNPDFDPGRVYSLAYQSGFAGLVWNKEHVPAGLRTMDDLWHPDLAGKVVVLSEFADTVGLIMMSQGVRVDQPFTDDQFMAALDVLAEKIDSGQVKQVRGGGYKEDLISGQAWAAIGWSGDIFQINAENDDRWGFGLPESGGTLWSDNFVIPRWAPNKAGAEELINFYYDPMVAAEVAAWVNYTCPVRGARELMDKFDPALADNQWIFPDDELLAQAQVFRLLTAAEEAAYTEAFGRVTQT